VLSAASVHERVSFLKKVSGHKAVVLVRGEQNKSIEKWWNDADMGKFRYSLGWENTVSFAVLSSANPAWLGLV